MSPKVAHNLSKCVVRVCDQNVVNQNNRKLHQALEFLLMLALNFQEDSSSYHKFEVNRIRCWLDYKIFWYMHTVADK